MSGDAHAGHVTDKVQDNKPHQMDVALAHFAWGAHDAASQAIGSRAPDLKLDQKEQQAKVDEGLSKEKTAALFASSKAPMGAMSDVDRSIKEKAHAAADAAVFGDEKKNKAA